MRNTPFVINPEKAKSPFRRNKRGKMSIAVREVMPERTEHTFLAMVKMAGGELGKVIKCSLKDIACARGATTNFDEDTVMKPLRNDIKLLLKTGIRIGLDDKNNDGKKRLIFNDTLIHGGITDDDWVEFDISQHLVRVVKDTKQGYFFVQYHIYSKLRSSIARRLYLHLVSQSKIRAGKEYEICLEKLCGHIGYIVEENPNWSVVRGRFKKPLRELKARGGIIKDSEFDRTRAKDEGFMFIAYGYKPDKPTKQLKAADRKQINTKYREVIDKIKDSLFENYDTKHLWNEGVLVKQLEVLEKYLQPILKDSFSDFIDDYCLWLIGMMPTDYFPKTVNLDKLYYSSKLFDENNPMFKQFMDGWESKVKAQAEADYWMNRDDDDDDEEMTDKKFEALMNR